MRIVCYNNSMITFRPASINDAALLLSWRNAPLTRRNSFSEAIVPLGDHIKWLKKALDSDVRFLYMAEKDGAAVGTVRFDRDGSGYELSWTVAPEWRGNETGKEMVRAALELYKNSPISCQIRSFNMPSIRIALYCGFNLTGVTGEETLVFKL